MSTLTQLAALRLQIAQLMQTRCAVCGHTLQVHRLAPRPFGVNRRHDPNCQERHRGDFVCECPGFADTTEVQEALKI